MGEEDAEWGCNGSPSSPIRTRRRDDPITRTGKRPCLEDPLRTRPVGWMGMGMTMGMPLKSLVSPRKASSCSTGDAKEIKYNK